MSATEDSPKCESLRSETEEVGEEQEEKEYEERERRFDPAADQSFTTSLTKASSNSILKLREALEYIRENVSTMITQVIIATDSPSLVKLVTEDLTKLARDNHFWRKNPVAIYSIWETLNADQVGYANEIQLDFRFWLVPEEMNQDAQAMAQSMEDREMQKIQAEFDSYLGARWGRNAQRAI
ncbi:hypothetical protein FDENT_3013 [Fusarium denticulatum]|uniref:Uncharacterized protein n=1 Tax=Fusarium denticulatum TaxID=48507 RepID=A0A8H5XEQ3_9HYPO|nr:hypothetical protein FDENT_3013 [Fusarium denticulatum]